MTFESLKSHLDILSVATDLGITINLRSQKALCPFHNDKTPSLQFSRDKQIATCFSSNCSAGTMDVINLVEKYRQISTGEAIKYLQNYTGLKPTTRNTSPTQKGLIKPRLIKPESVKSEPVVTEPRPDYASAFEKMESSLISSTIGRKYLESRHFNAKKLAVGYNAFKNSRFSYLRGCVTFGLRDRDNKVVSLYGRSVRDNDKSKHYYTTNRQGLYPHYLKPETKKLILTESIIDATSLLQFTEITKEYEVLACFGTNGFMAEHVEAIKELKSLEEVIIWFDGDEAGDKGIFGYTDEDGDHKPGIGERLQSICQHVQIRYVETPRGEDVNSLIHGHDSKILSHLLQEAKPFFFKRKQKKNLLKIKSPVRKIKKSL